MNELPPDMNGDELDRQIRAALQAEASPQGIHRLEAFWRRQSRARRRRRRIVVASALAASMLAALTASLHFYEPGSVAAIDASPPVTPVVPEPSPTHVVESPVAEPSAAKEQPRVTVRAPTSYERFIFAARSPRTSNRPTAAVVVNQLIERLTLDPELDVSRLVQASGLDRPAIEKQLLRRLPRTKNADLPSVVRLLRDCGTVRSTTQLLRLAQRSEFRNEALATIERIVGAAGLADMAGRSSDPGVRAAIYYRLLAAEDERSLSAYLALIQGGVLSDEALAVANELSEPLLVRLLYRLDDEDQDVRLAAALVLGHANGPAVSEALIRRVTATEKPRGCREAWIALFACRDERARRFFAYAARQPQLLGSFNLARVWWHARI